MMKVSACREYERVEVSSTQVQLDVTQSEISLTIPKAVLKCGPAVHTTTTQDIL